MRRHFERAAVVVVASFAALVVALAVATAVGIPRVYTDQSIDLLESSVCIGLGYLLAAILTELQRRRT